MGVLEVNVRNRANSPAAASVPGAQRTLGRGRPLTSYPLHLHTPGLDAALGQPLLGNNAADVVREDEGGLEDGEGLGVGAGCRLVDDDIQGTAVVLHSGHLHVLGGQGQGGRKWLVRSRRRAAAQKLWEPRLIYKRLPSFNSAFALRRPSAS